MKKNWNLLVLMLVVLAVGIFIGKRKSGNPAPGAELVAEVQKKFQELDAKSTDDLIRELESKDQMIVDRAMMGLQGRNELKAVEALLAQTKNVDPDRRYSALLSLVRTNREAALRASGELSKDSDEEVSELANRILAEFPSEN